MNKNKEYNNDASQAQKQTDDNTSLSNNNNIPKSQNSENCIDKDFVSSDIIREKVKAHEKIIKANDLKVISGVAAQAPILIIDKDLPDSESSRLRKELDLNFQLWKGLFRQTLKENGNNRSSYFMQMKSLEKVFIENKYEPYLNFVQTQQMAQDTFFIQSNEKKFMSKNYLKKKH